MQLSIEEVSKIFHELPQIRDAVVKKYKAMNEDERARRIALIEAANLTAAELVELEKNKDQAQQDLDGALSIAENKRIALFHAGQRCTQTRLKLSRLLKQIDAAGEKHLREVLSLLAAKMSWVETRMEGIRQLINSHGKTSYIARVMQDGPLAAASTEKTVSRAKDRLKALEQSRNQLLSLEIDAKALEMAPISPDEMLDRCDHIKKALEAIEEAEF